MYAADDGVEASFVDLGLQASDMHTGHSSRANVAALNAFLDFLLLLDATVIVRTGSSFSGTVCVIKGLKCIRSTIAGFSTAINICLPTNC